MFPLKKCSTVNIQRLGPPHTTNTTQQLDDSASHQQSCEQTLHTT